MTRIINEEEIDARFRYAYTGGNGSELARSAFKGGARWAEKLTTDRLVEAAARAVYEEWKDEPGYVPWVLAGNSHKQDEARHVARKALLEGWK